MYKLDKILTFNNTLKGRLIKTTQNKTKRKYEL